MARSDRERKARREAERRGSVDDEAVVAAGRHVAARSTAELDLALRRVFMREHRYTGQTPEVFAGSLLKMVRKEVRRLAEKIVKEDWDYVTGGHTATYPSGYVSNDPGLAGGWAILATWRHRHSPRTRLPGRDYGNNYILWSGLEGRRRWTVIPYVDEKYRIDTSLLREPPPADESVVIGFKFAPYADSIRMAWPEEFGGKGEGVAYPQVDLWAKRPALDRVTAFPPSVAWEWAGVRREMP